MIYILCALFLAIIITVMVMLSDPLRKSEEKIRESLFKITPIGMDIDDVIKVIKNKKKWELGHVNYNNGYSILGGNPNPPSPAGDDTILGKKSIIGNIGRYMKYYIIEVEVFWAFDEDSKLIDLHVRKEGL